MKINMKNYLVVVAIIISFLPASFVLADDDPGQQFVSNQFIYVFRLYYENNQLIADRTAQFKYDIVAEPYEAASIDTITPYYGEIVNFQGSILGKFQFNPIVKGRLSVKGPYFADASKANFYNDQGQLLFTIDVSGSSFCNNDGVCDSDAGEDMDNCSTDCKLKPAPSVSVVPVPDSSGRSYMFVGVIVVILIVVLMIWFIIKKRKAASGMTPPTLPPVVPPSLP